MTYDGQYCSSSAQSVCCEGNGCRNGVDHVSRRRFLTASGIGLSALAMTGVSWSSAMGAAAADHVVPGVRKLVVKPVLAYETPARRPQTSWRNWGGIQTEQDAQKEVASITRELDQMRETADFPLSVLPVSTIKSAAELNKLEDLGSADVLLLCAAGGGMDILDAAAKSGKHVIFFLRHRSGPVYLWYEIISPRYLHQHSDKLAVKNVDNQDVVIDSVAEIQWRLRSLAGLKNATGTKIVAIGGAGGWGPGGAEAPKTSQQKWKMDISAVNYEDLSRLLKDALSDRDAMRTASRRADEYLNDPGVKLETEKVFVSNAFLLEQIFRGLMNQAGARAITINACMGAIMPISKTTACLTLSLLNDAGYMAFCESDFVVIPAGILLSSVSGRPHFLNDPTYPHDGVITLAHCTAPRRMDGKNLEPVRILTHFESDYGAAPKVEMRSGQAVTSVIPDFGSSRYVGLLGHIVDTPFLPICRSQIDVAYKVPDARLAENMPGFHWETVYGDFTKEMGYALKKIPIGWEFLG